MLKPLAFVLELAALVMLITAFASTPFRWEFGFAGLALFAAGLAIRRR